MQLPVPETAICACHCYLLRHQFFKSNLSLYSLYYAEAGNEFAGPISASLRPGTQLRTFEEMLRRWRAVGNAVSDLTDPRFEPQTSRSRDECVAARPPGPQFLTIRIDVTRYVKARSHINFQIKTLQKYKISQSRGRSVFFLFQKKKIRQQN